MSDYNLSCSDCGYIGTMEEFLDTAPVEDQLALVEFFKQRVFKYTGPDSILQVAKQIG